LWVVPPPKKKWLGAGTSWTSLAAQPFIRSTQIMQIADVVRVALSI